MSDDRLSDRTIFLRYAWPCADDKLAAGKIIEKDYGYLKWCVENKIEPDEEILKRCFPKAFEDSLKFSNARDYWHQHQGSDASCAVRFLVVLGIKDNLVKVGLSRPAINLYGLSLEPGEIVTVHKHMIIEKLESAAAR